MIFNLLMYSERIAAPNLKYSPTRSGTNALALLCIESEFFFPRRRLAAQGSILKTVPKTPVGMSPSAAVP